MLTWPVTSIGWVSSLVRKASASQSRINAFLDSKPFIKSGNKPVPEDGILSFEQVSFRYPETGITALNGINLRILSGRLTGITGRTGSGKSTLIALLLRQYDPDEGCIRYGGTDIREFDLTEWRSRLSIVFQDVFLFSDTLARNISRESQDEKQWEEIFTTSGLSETVGELKEGRNTLVGERGLMLSGGQKQRVSIARAIKKPGSILVLDDCFSAIDPLTEKRISGELSKLKFRQTLIISHRPATLMHCDNIYFLDEGKVAGSGNHEDLMEKLEAYRQLSSMRDE
jgi:ATP-binding cassette subfamily B multidrug efflux pump